MIKHIQFIAVCLFSVALLSGCNSQNSEAPDVSSDNTDSTVSESMQATEFAAETTSLSTDSDSETALPETHTDSQTTAESESTQTTSTVSESMQATETAKSSGYSEATLSEALRESTAADSQTAAESESTQTTVTVSETVQSSDDEVIIDYIDPEQSCTTSIYSDGTTKYTDKYSGNEYIILNVTPDKIYWNESDDDVKIGQPFDIAIPAVFEDWLTDADEVMIYIDSAGGNAMCDIKLDDITVKGMPYTSDWSTDYLCPIKGDTVCFGEYTDSIKNSFRDITDGVYIEEKGFLKSLNFETLFENNMSVSDLDLFFEKIKEKSDEIHRQIEEDPYTNYEINELWLFQSGIRFRASINKIY